MLEIVLINQLIIGKQMLLALKDYLNIIEILELYMQVHQQHMVWKNPYAMSKYSMEQLDHNNAVGLRFTTFMVYKAQEKIC